MKRQMAIMFTGAVFFAAAAAMAVTIDFTSAEGYSEGQLYAHTDWGAVSYFMVDPSGAGTVTLDGSLGWQKAFYKSGFASTNDTYKVGIEFSFSRSTDALAANKNVLLVSFLEVAGYNGKRLDMQLQRLSSNNEKYRLAFYENSGSVSSSAFSEYVDEDDMGFDDASDTESDRLWLSLTLNRGADASSWTASGVISNLTDGAVLAELDCGTFDTSDAFFTDVLYPSINNAHPESQSFTSNRVVDVFHATAEVTADELLLPSSMEIDFISGEGYSTNQLRLHADWGGDDYFLLDPNGSGTVELDSSSVGWKKVFHRTGLAAAYDAYTVGIDFSFDRSTNALDQDRNVLAISFFDAAGVNRDRLDVMLQRMGSNSEEYRLVFYEDSSGDTWVASEVFSEDALGFDNASDGESDSIGLSLTLIRGVDTSSWTAIGVASNLTDGTLLQTVYSGTFETESTFFTDPLYPAMCTANLESQSLTSNRLVDVFRVSAGEYEAPATTVDFTSAEGYVPGAIFGQQLMWAGHDEPGFRVDDTTNCLELPATAEWKQAIYNAPVEATNSVLDADGVFRFNRFISAPTNDFPLFMFGWKPCADTTTGRGSVRAMLLRTPQAYRIGFFYEDLASGIFSYSHDELIEESALGFDSSVENDESDDLMLGLRLCPGTTTNDWSAVVVLSNMTANTLVSSFTMSDGLFTVSTNFLDVPLYGFIDSACSNDAVNVSNRLVDCFTVGGAFYESAYAEWAARYGLSGSDSGVDANPDGDALNNIEEYGLGGNPADGDDIGYKPTVGISLSGGTNYFDFVHVVRVNPAIAIDYIVETRSDLLSGSWTNAGIMTAAGTQDSTFDIVTNRVSMEGETKGFVRLRIIEQ